MRCRHESPLTPPPALLPPSTTRLQGTRFFWRSKENIDVAFHYNSDEDMITISTRCPERSYNYPAIFVDASKIPASKTEAVRQIRLESTA